mmetsp:Transcript_38385/g.85473  ORF Transcript_38385/g.85473 Transcript_38385/m.85473 type:complete len:274 (+) Transcript_38385:867-1688(+)|eukprot:CAMPEP_0202898072 /NCGR_PEP_ID=MMETSP1392-20130828/6681_1 /ASSEMBLY_ACC=CAM_ASM_000868 /TAXON_ID=225041 /ORGANISM="Chlamydomonas chlamydogama, Strain SAG 11-48b" /LENGTH=273 /DNA_ID=CAMNT_0049583895 /DNA_START=821 /DNA_END=1642 /DNA_ORIENTATION=-
MNTQLMLCHLRCCCTCWPLASSCCCCCWVEGQLLQQVQRNIQHLQLHWLPWVVMVHEVVLGAAEALHHGLHVNEGQAQAGSQGAGCCVQLHHVCTPAQWRVHHEPGLGAMGADHHVVPCKHRARPQQLPREGDKRFCLLLPGLQEAGGKLGPQLQQAQLLGGCCLCQPGQVPQATVEEDEVGGAQPERVAPLLPHVGQPLCIAACHAVVPGAVCRHTWYERIRQYHVVAAGSAEEQVGSQHLMPPGARLPGAVHAGDVPANTGAESLEGHDVD